MKLTIQRMARIAILSALAVGLRSAFIGLPNIQPITAMFFVAVLYLGLVDGLLIMALTMSISGFRVVSQSCSASISPRPL